MATLHIYLFGQPRVETDGVAIHIERRKVMALLAYLAVTPQIQSRDVLAALLWPGYGQSDARAHLRRTLSNLTNAIGKDWLDITRQSIGMKYGSGLWVDVRAFADEVAAVGAIETTEGLAALNAVSELYTDDFLRGFSLPDSADFDDWKSIQAEQLRQQLLTLLQNLVQGYSALGAVGHDAALACAQRWLTLDPLHELAHRYVMQLHAWRGDRVAALAQYRECVRLLHEELGVEPEEATQKLMDDIRSGAAAADQATTLVRAAEPSSSTTVLQGMTALPPSSVALPPPNLPHAFTPFYGRTTELARIQTLLVGDARLVSIVGESGVGKSRLAVAAAANLLESFGNHIWFVPLHDLDSYLNVHASADTMDLAKDPTKDPANSIQGTRNRPFQVSSAETNDKQEALAAAMMTTLHIPRSGVDDQSIQEQLLSALPAQKMALLLDNFEQALPAADLLITLLRRFPNLSVLVTSTEPLRLQAEHVLRLSGLPLPEAPSPTVDDSEQSAAIQLFVGRAQQRTPSFVVDADNLAPIVEICTLAVGSPLVIELAAAWTEHFTCAEIADALRKLDFDFLAASPRDTPERHRSLRNVFEYSWSLLGPTQQQVLAQLAVFQGEIERAAALAVTGGSMPDLVSLGQKSLLRQMAPGHFDMHRLLQNFAKEKLEQLGLLAETRQRYATYFLELVHTQEGRMLGADAESAMAVVQDNLENIRAAWHWATAHEAWELLSGAALGLVRFYQRQGLHHEGLEVLGFAVQHVRRLRRQSAPSPSSPKLLEAEQLLNRLMAMLLRRRPRSIPMLGH